MSERDPGMKSLIKNGPYNPNLLPPRNPNQPYAPTISPELLELMIKYPDLYRLLNTDRLIPKKQLPPIDFELGQKEEELDPNEESWRDMLKLAVQTPRPGDTIPSPHREQEEGLDFTRKSKRAILGDVFEEAATKAAFNNELDDPEQIAQDTAAFFYLERKLRNAKIKRRPR